MAAFQPPPHGSPEEYAFYEKGDGETLRVWTIDVIWRGAEDLSARKPEDVSWVAAGILDVQRAYVRALVGLDWLVWVGSVPGCQNRQRWRVRARSRVEADAAFHFSPLAEVGMGWLESRELPETLLDGSPAIEKAMTLPFRHPYVDRLLAGMTFEEVLAWSEESAGESDAAEFFRACVLWRWMRKVEEHLPEVATPDMLDALWRSIFLYGSRILEADEASQTLDRGRRALRGAEAKLAEFGIDVKELKRRYREEHGMEDEPEDP